LETGDDGGVWVKWDSMQADAWRRHWRAIGQLEPVRSGRTGMYARKLPSVWPPGSDGAAQSGARVVDRRLS
jgi:hypothetical protein